jgi:hypothetical protein
MPRPVYEDERGQFIVKDGEWLDGVGLVLGKDLTNQRVFNIDPH